MALLYNNLQVRLSHQESLINNFHFKTDLMRGIIVRGFDYVTEVALNDLEVFSIGQIVTIIEQLCQSGAYNQAVMVLNAAREVIGENAINFDSYGKYIDELRFRFDVSKALTTEGSEHVAQITVDNFTEFNLSEISIIIERLCQKGSYEEVSQIADVFRKVLNDLISGNFIEIYLSGASRKEHIFSKEVFTTMREEGYSRATIITLENITQLTFNQIGIVVGHFYEHEADDQAMEIIETLQVNLDLILGFTIR